MLGYVMSLDNSACFLTLKVCIGCLSTCLSKVPYWHSTETSGGSCPKQSAVLTNLYVVLVAQEAAPVLARLTASTVAKHVASVDMPAAAASSARGTAAAMDGQDGAMSNCERTMREMLQVMQVLTSYGWQGAGEFVGRYCRTSVPCNRRQLHVLRVTATDIKDSVAACGLHTLESKVECFLQLQYV